MKIETGLNTDALRIAETQQIRKGHWVQSLEYKCTQRNEHNVCSELQLSAVPTLRPAPRGERPQSTAYPGFTRALSWTAAYPSDSYQVEPRSMYIAMDVDVVPHCPGELNIVEYRCESLIHTHTHTHRHRHTLVHFPP